MLRLFFDRFIAKTYRYAWAFLSQGLFGINRIIYVKRIIHIMYSKNNIFNLKSLTSPE